MKSKSSITYFVFLMLFACASAICLAQKPELVVQTGHSGSVHAVAFSADGKVLASGGGDSMVKLWDLATGHELRTLAGHSGEVFSLAFSRDGQILASGSLDQTVKLWDLAAGRELHTLEGHSNTVFSVVFSQDGKILVSSSSDQTIRFWEVGTGKLLRTLTDDAGVFLVALTPDGNMLASTTHGKGIKLWDVASGRSTRTLEPLSEFRSIEFSPDSKTLATGGKDKTVKLLNVATGRAFRTLTGHSDAVESIQFNADGTRLVTGSWDKTVKVWEVATGRELSTFTGHRGWVNSVAFSPNGMSVASGSEDRTINLWDTATGRASRTLRGHTHQMYSVAVSADGKKIASGSSDKTIKMWDLATGEMRALPGYYASDTFSVAFSPDGAILAHCSSDHTVKLWAVATGRELRTLTGLTGACRSVAFSGDGRTLASAGDGTAILLWEVDSGRKLTTITANDDLIKVVALSPDGKMLATGSFGKTIQLFEVGTGRLKHTLSGHSFAILSIAFSADGKILASGSGDYTVKLWDTDTGKELRSLLGHSSPFVSSVAFSPDGKTLATASWDRTITLWEFAKGKELRTLKGHSDYVYSIAFSSNGEFLVSGGKDCVTNLWRVDSGELLASSVGLDESDWAVVTSDGHFDASPNGQKLMHWMLGNERIDLEQLKERYYEPGLLAKIFNGQPLRDVNKFENPKLNPEVTYEPPVRGSSTLVVNLTNRGGGIGRVQVLINDKEFLADARDEKLRGNPNVSRTTLNIDLSRAPGKLSGEENKIRVQAWNVENYISSRGDEKPWVAPGPTNKEPPEVYAIVGGISQYAGTRLKLRYAGTDAVAMANAIALGAKRLFGADKVHLTLLTTAKDPRAIAPTKANFNEAFAAVRRQAKPKDILVVYLAGHAITFQQGGQDTYCYLTQEAQTTDVSDPEVRRQRTVTSDDLRDWIKLVPANKQAIMLDTCAAGAAQEQFIAAARAGSGDAVRAIELAMDRTGSHFLMGSAADAESFETSQYGQGLLTYALLKGIKGEALDDARMVDINTLFRFAREEVERLAKNIDKIQKPKISAPKGDTFPVGQLTREDALKIVLVVDPKPIILRPRFYDEQTDDDTLELEKNLRELIRNETESGTGEAAFGFSNTEDFQGGIKPIARYKVEGNMVTVMLRLRRDGIEMFAAPMKVTGTKDNIAARIIEAIKSAIAKL